MQKKAYFNPPIPHVQLRSNGIIFYSKFDYNGKKNILGFQQKSYSGVTTNGAQKRIRKAVDLLVQLSPERWATNPTNNKRFRHKLSFITLTVPGKEEHINCKYGNKNLLAPWIRIMKRKHNMVTYIWKAEFQENGQLHYHITTPSVVHYQYIKDTWNNLLASRGLLTNWYNDGHKKAPNSTDIHKVKKSNDMAWYLAKEISKTLQDKRADSKIWDCSHNIKNNKLYSDIQPSEFMQEIISSDIIYLENCSILKTTNPLKYFNPRFIEKYNNWRKSITEKSLF